MSRSRIRKAYETQFAWMLQRAGARRVDQGALRMVEQAQRSADAQKISLASALTHRYERLARMPKFQRPLPANGSGACSFYCDAGLGGLSRWLRVAGYRSWWIPGIDDDDLLRAAAQKKAIVLTTDSMLMERRVVRKNIIPSFWLPPILSVGRQLELVFREFKLSLRQTRCMNCGGALCAVEKERLRDRIPPRTYIWIQHYWVCENCAGVFWHGTHWQKIRSQLEAITATGAPPDPG